MSPVSRTVSPYQSPEPSLQTRNTRGKTINPFHVTWGRNWGEDLREAVVLERSTPWFTSHNSMFWSSLLCHLLRTVSSGVFLYLRMHLRCVEKPCWNTLQGFYQGMYCPLYFQMIFFYSLAASVLLLYFLFQLLIYFLIFSVSLSLFMKLSQAYHFTDASVTVLRA